MKKIVSFAASLLFIGATGLAFAAETTAPAPKPVIHHPRIHEVHDRMKDQEARIKEGLKSGKLTPAQAKALRDVLKSVQAQMEADYKTNGKRELTDDQKKQLNQMLDENSKTIYGEKHDDGSTSPSGSTGTAPSTGTGNTTGTSPAAGTTTGQ